MPIFIAFLSAFVLSTGIQPATSQTAGLRIVVVAGEDAVNIIQQKTAVAPIVEIRDRNNLPVAGATVTFTIGGNAATFAGGAQTLTVVTNAAGQAAAAGFTPTAAGAIQINASALVQGQALTATITQTNVMTAAQAAAAGGAGGAGGGTGGGTGTAGAGGGAGGGGGAATGGAVGGAGGAGGGLSGLAIGGIVGGAAAVAGGVLVAAGGGDDSSTSGTTTPTTSTTTPSTSTPTTTTPTTPQPTTVTYNGPITGTFTSSGTAENITCTFIYAVSGTMSIALTTQSNGSVTGTGSGTMSFRESSGQCTVPFPISVDPDGSENGSIPFTGPVTGTASSFRFSQTNSQSIPVSGGSVQTSFETAFTGSLSGGTITGQLTQTSSSTFNIPGLNLRGSGTGSSTVTLRP